ncbi:MAG: hypothetical protein JWR72_2615 [Flavisolibacter sp.]|nr:hypothetical protein [Flavisolibacter sp.]
MKRLLRRTLLHSYRYAALCNIITSLKLYIISESLKGFNINTLGATQGKGVTNDRHNPEGVEQLCSIPFWGCNKT